MSKKEIFWQNRKQSENAEKYLHPLKFHQSLGNENKYV